MFFLQLLLPYCVLCLISAFLSFVFRQHFPEKSSSYYKVILDKGIVAWVAEAVGVAHSHVTQICAIFSAIRTPCYTPAPLSKSTLWQPWHFQEQCKSNQMTEVHWFHSRKQSCSNKDRRSRSRGLRATPTLSRSHASAPSSKWPSNQPLHFQEKCCTG